MIILVKTCSKIGAISMWMGHFFKTWYTYVYVYFHILNSTALPKPILGPPHLVEKNK